MREKIIAHGIVCGKWIAIEEAPNTADGRRQMICRCMACRRETIIRLDKLRDGTAAPCYCKREIPARLPVGGGFNCNYRVRGAKECVNHKNRAGFCCYHCGEKENCRAACQNTPDKCKSFYNTENLKDLKGEKEWT